MSTSGIKVKGLSEKRRKAMSQAFDEAYAKMNRFTSSPSSAITIRVERCWFWFGWDKTVTEVDLYLGCSRVGTVTLSGFQSAQARRISNHWNGMNTQLQQSL